MWNLFTYAQPCDAAGTDFLGGGGVCRPRKQVLLNIFLGISGSCHQAPVKASSSTPPPLPDIYPPPPLPNENMKIRLCDAVQVQIQMIALLIKALNPKT